MIETSPNDVIQLEKNVLVGTYARPPFVINRGEGVYVFDTTGKKYLDFVSGIAVNALGYCDQELLAALKKQAERIWHCSNLYLNEPQIRLAKKLVDLSFADKVFFCNSGTEAIEGAIKFARKWAHEEKNITEPEIIAFHNSFHGRTLGALSATGQPKFWEGFEPLLPGFKFAELNNLNSVKSLINARTCAILIEPVQGEGGIYLADRTFMKQLKGLCEQYDILLIADEIQCGMARTGKLFAYEHFDIEPDVMTLAKPLAGGLPLGAILLKDKVAAHVRVGDHGSTFGGGPLVCAVAEYIISRIRQPEFLQRIEEIGNYLLDQLNNLAVENDEITEVRGIGLMTGISLKNDPKPIIDACAQNGLLVCKAGNNTVRFIPPLVVEKEHIDGAMAIFRKILK